jgi:cell division protein FtsZ
MHDKESRYPSNAVIKVIGVGGGGGNAINTMIESGLTGVEFIAANTDLQALQSNLASIKIQLGRELTKGLGAGANPDIGRDAALEDKAIIQEVLGGADMVFVTAGMGGGTGTGAAPIIAQVARELGALTVGVVTKPFIFEGKRRRSFSDNGIQSLRASVDTLITIPNQRLLSIAPPNMSMLEGFKLADDVLLNAVKGISDIINIPGRVNVDFADVKTIMSEMGMALMGIGVASGPNRATEAARSAINSPLLEDIDIEGATGILINITGSSSMTLHETSEACTLIQEAAHEEANVIFGAVIDDSMGDNIRVTVIATGFDQAHVAFPENKMGNLGMVPQQQHHNPQSMYTQGGMGNPMPPQGMNPQNQPHMRPGYGNPQYDNMRPSQPQRPAPQQGNSYSNPLPRNGQDMNNFRQTAPQQENIDNRRQGYNQPSPQQRNISKEPESQAQHSSSGPRVEFEDLTQWTMDMSRNNEQGSRTKSAHAPESSNHERPISGASILTEKQYSNYGTESALNLARELSDVEISEDDFETPAFLRRKEEHPKNT